SLSPAIIGEEKPPPMRTFQVGFKSLGSDVMAGASAGAWPLRVGPRHCGQSAAPAELQAASNRDAAEMPKAFRFSLLILIIVSFTSPRSVHQKAGDVFRQVVGHQRQ